MHVNILVYDLGEAVTASLAQPPSSAPGQQPSTTSQETTQYVRVVNPVGALVTPHLNHSSAAAPGMRIDYGAILLSTAIDHSTSGTQRFRVPGGWLNERSREDGEMVCEVVGSLETLSSLTSSKLDILLGKEEAFCIPVLKSIVPVLVDLHTSVMGPHLKVLTRSIIHKTLYHVPSETLEALMVDDSNWVGILSTFISGLASSRQELSLIAGLQIATVLVEKVPQAMSQALIREGIVSAANTYLSRDSTPEMTDAPFSCSPLTSPGSFFPKPRAKEPAAGEVASLDDLTRPMIASLCESLVGRVRRGSIGGSIDVASHEGEVSRECCIGKCRLQY